MSTKSQRIEQVYERFRDHCKELQSKPYQVWEDTPQDPPDICVGDNDIGIEFVNFLHGASSDGGSELKAIEVYFHQVVEEARQLFESRNTTPLIVGFFFHDTARPHKKEKQTILTTIVELIEKQLDKVGDEPIELDWDDFENTILAGYLIHIDIWRINDIQHWSTKGAGWVGFGVDALLPLVQNKETKLQEYHNQFNSVWLVIVAQGFSISSTAMLDETVQPGSIQSQFDRVYFFDVFSNYILCLSGGDS